MSWKLYFCVRQVGRQYMISVVKLVLNTKACVGEDEYAILNIVLSYRNPR